MGIYNAEDWSHLVGFRTELDVVLTEEDLKRWEASPEQQFKCVFCDTVGNGSYFTLPDTDFVRCPVCKEYKGLQPAVAGWNIEK